MIPIHHFAHKPGARVKARSCYGGYPLPPGIPEGATVTVISSGIGDYLVEFEGRTYTVSMTCLELPAKMQNTPTSNPGPPPESSR